MTSKENTIIYFFIITITFIVYAHALQFDFVNYDDDEYTYQNPMVTSGLHTDGIVAVFSKAYKANWIPLTLISYMVDVEIFGLSPFGFHFTNILFHILNSLLVFIILEICTNRKWLSFIVAILFAIHPMHVESVVWISERKDVLSTFFGLSAIFFYIRYKLNHNFENYVAVFLFFVCSLMSKPMLVTFPLLLLLLDVWPLKLVMVHHALRNYKKSLFFLAEKIPFFAASMVFGIIALYSQQSGGTIGSMSAYPLSERLLNSVIAYGKYIGKLFLPVNLAVIYPYQYQTDYRWLTFSICIFVIITYASIFFIEKKTFLFVGWLWFLISLLPVIGLIQIGTQSMADRYTYLPSLGLFIAAVWEIDWMTDKFQINKTVITMLITVILSVFAIITLNQIEIWKNGETLFRHTLEVTSNNWVAHLNYGEALLSENKIDQAIGQFRQALAIKPDFEMAYLNIGVALSKKGQIDRAIAYYRKALLIKPDQPITLMNLGNAYFRKNQIDRAFMYYEKALSVKPDYADAYCNIGAVMVHVGNYEKAIEAFTEALKINPGSIKAKNGIMMIGKKINKH